MLLTIDSVLSAEELANIRALLGQADWATGAYNAGPVAAGAKNNQQLRDNDPRLPALRKIVYAAINRSAVFFTAALPLKILPPFFNRYAGDANQYAFHTDNAMRLVPGQQGAYVRADLSATLFLSEPEEYSGGILTIDDIFGRHGVKGKAGSMVLYPSSSVHAVTPVTSGERVACFLFIQSMVRDTEKRRLLYGLDMALLALRAQGADSEAVTRLTGSYHNLLRMWADS